MKKQRGCEWDSPIFRQIMAEKKKNNLAHIFGDVEKQLDNLIEYKPKRGKYNGREQR